MYDYRKMAPETRKIVIQIREQRGYPLHSPPHIDQDDVQERLIVKINNIPHHYRFISAACFEHRDHIDPIERRSEFTDQLLTTAKEHAASVDAWVILPNHFHFLALIVQLDPLAEALAELFQSTASKWNKSDDAQGRKVWCRFSDRIIRSKAHYFSTLNYVHQNPIKHGYVKKQHEWPFSSFHQHLDEFGRASMIRRWKDFPPKNYGDGWDDF